MSGDCGHPQIKRIGHGARARCGMCGLPIGAYDGRLMVERDLGGLCAVPPPGGDGGGGMTDTSEALARLLFEVFHEQSWEQGEDFTRNIYLTEATAAVAAGWRPPEPQAAPVAADDSLEAARLWTTGRYTGLTDRAAADDFARALLAEHARAEAPAEVPDGR